MDHLPYPDNAILPPLKIPYICKDIEAYDGQGFHDYPLRKGWNEPFQCTFRDIARAQSWLYFGLLSEFFGESFDTKDFVDVTADGEQVVTTRKLKALLQKSFQENSKVYTWMASHGFRDMSKRGFLRGRPEIRLNERLMSTLQLAEVQSHILDGGDRLACVIALSIKVLIWSIGNGLVTYLPSRKERVQFAPRNSRLLRGAMLNGGKCPYWTEIYLRSYSPGMIYYLAAMPQMDGRANHRGCSAQRCIAHDTDDESYVVEHVHDCSGCDMTGPDPAKVRSIIENRGIPLMRFRELLSGDLALDVVQATYGMHYTAISHVWSGGLGNPDGNTLPQCQLKSIRKDRKVPEQCLYMARQQRHFLAILGPNSLIYLEWIQATLQMLITETSIGLRLARGVADADSGLYPWRNRIYRFLFHRKRVHDELFWMDTLCVPVKSGEAIRRKAIRQMNFTYAGADNVLVLDPVLRSISKRSASRLQLRVQVACSIWMTRCWTFQEACLARAWHVFLHTNLYEPAMDYRREADPLFRVLTQQTIWTDESELEYEAVSFYGKMWPLVDQDPGYKPPIIRGSDGGDVSGLVKIWNELDQRSTTHRKDRQIILAILLDLDVGEIVGLDVEERMKAILGTQRSLPLSLLFEPQQEPTSTETKCHWIPLYPEGTVSAVYGCMTQNRSRDLYQFTLADIKANGFILDPKYSSLNQGLINQTLPHAFKAWVRVTARADCSPHCRPRATCIILSRMKKVSSSLRSPLVGARFFVQSNDTGGKTYTMIYDGPLIYDKITSAESLSPTEYPQVEAVAMPDDTQILIDCGRW
ncbi:MAG: hypothetical protein Q9225_000829 [Loekoesia sp. 1 TL-2023]